MTIFHHIRLAGSVLVLIGVIIHQTPLVMLGFLVNYLGVIWGIDYIEKQLQEKENVDE